MLDGRFVFERDPSMDDTPIDDIQAEPIENSLLWGDRVTKRLMLKIAIELLAYFDGSAARCDELIAARRFARYDEGDDWEFRAGPDMETSGAKLKHIDATYIHGIEIWTAGNRLNYMMIILSKMHWVGTLSHSWKCGPFRAAYSFDIRDPGNKCVEHDKSDGATLVNKSFRVRMAELQKATVLLTETIKQHAERRRMRAPAPDLNDLYPEVAAAMNKSKK